jgi:clan AA aspartic protease (TIGR02281 family)
VAVPETQPRSYRSRAGAALVGLLLLAVAIVPVRGVGRGAPARIQLHGDEKSWLVEAAIDGRARGHFLLDTGSSYCVIAPALARELGLATESLAIVETANGSVNAPLVRLASLDLGGRVRVDDVQAIVHDAGPLLDGVLGLNLLNRYRYAIDPERRLLELE